jgi:hypothetical protein
MQKFTVPGETPDAPDATVAVNVTTLFEGTVVTGLPPEVTASAVVEFATGDSVKVAVATGDDKDPTTAIASKVSVELTVIAVPRVYTVEPILTVVPVVPLWIV